MTGVYVYTRVTRYTHEVRVCSGDFSLEKDVRSFPFMRKSGNLLWWYTWVRGLATKMMDDNTDTH